MIDNTAHDFLQYAAGPPITRFCAAEHLTDGFLCSLPVGHGGDHEARDGAIVYRRWPVEPPEPQNPPVEPPEPQNPCALEDVPHDDCPVNPYEGGSPDRTAAEALAGGWNPRLAVWWRWPEPKGLTFPDDPRDAGEASTASGEKVGVFASKVTKGAAGLYLHDIDDDEACVILTPAELRSLRDRCDVILTHGEAES